MLDKLKNIRCIVLDIDGVLTDGTLLVMPGNLLLRTMNVKDGYALQLAQQAGLDIVVISGGNAAEVGERLEKLGVSSVFLSERDKLARLKSLALENGWTPDTMLFMGDDIPDVEVMKYVGFAACPSDAVPEVKAVATYISPRKGGKGCVRDIIEKTMKMQGKWTNTTDIPST
jgi:3-deoxy-D-manno-octulosonate 8-phosphate phosphatase (KDO 8-P phosphatase)